MTDAPIEPIWETLLKAGYKKQAQRKLKKRIKELAEELKRNG